jgi:hypothetical protein
VGQAPAWHSHLPSVLLGLRAEPKRRILQYHQQNWSPHKVLTYVENRAVSRVLFQNIDPPPPSPPSECVLPPHQRRVVHTRRAGGGWGWGVNILEDARHRIGLLQYNLSTGAPLILPGQLLHMPDPPRVNVPPPPTRPSSCSAAADATPAHSARAEHVYVHASWRPAETVGGPICRPAPGGGQEGRRPSPSRWARGKKSS